MSTFPFGYYWARNSHDGKITVVKLDLFGWWYYCSEYPDAVLSEDLEILCPVEQPEVKNA